MNKVSDQVILNINEPGDEFTQRYPNQVHVDRQPLGLSFFQMDWNEENKGNVRIVCKQHSLEVSDVLGFTGTQADFVENEGMSRLSVISGITGKTGISHKDALDKFYNILTKLRDSGWRSVIPLSSPRLTGKAMFDYLLRSKQPTTLDASYKPSLEEWMELQDLTTWEFYADNTFIKVNFVRDGNKMDLNKPGAYVIRYKLESEINYFKDFVSPRQREKWRELLPMEIKAAAARRQKIESGLVSSGVRIEENYQDPPLPK